jgi:predicted TIM-barrel fold metal-dependent hydrolase
MDYLGVDRSLVWHLQARDLNPTWGNRALLQEIDVDPEGAQRLIPAMVVTPASLFERGALDALVDVFEAGRSRGLRMFPRRSRFPVGQIERCLQAIAHFRPAVFVDVQDSMDHGAIGELAGLARALPEVQFVCTQFMWGDVGDMLDVLWRCPNVSVDTSWLHTRGGIELFVEQFGAERVLFGLGPRCHYGAAIAALNHAQISDGERRKIAHENAARLLGIACGTQPLCNDHPALSGKPLWLTCRDGRPVTQTRIVDAHSHTGPHTRGWYLPDIDIEENIRNLVAQMDRIGVDRMLIIPEHALFGEPVVGNRYIEEKLAGFRDRLSGYLVYNPFYEDTLRPVLEEFLAGDFFVGFKILPSYWQIGLADPRYAPVWETADRYRAPILIHTWSCPYASPHLLSDIVGRYPGASFLLGHSGGGGDRSAAEDLAVAHDNVYLEFCGSFTSPVPWEETSGASAIRKSCSDRIPGRTTRRGNLDGFSPRHYPMPSSFPYLRITSSACLAPGSPFHVGAPLTVRMSDESHSNHCGLLDCSRRLRFRQTDSAGVA